MTDAQTRIETLRNRIKASDSIADEDRELLLEFSDELYFRRNQYSYTRHLKLLNHLMILAGESARYDREQLPDDLPRRWLLAIDERAELEDLAQTLWRM